MLDCLCILSSYFLCLEKEKFVICSSWGIKIAYNDDDNSNNNNKKKNSKLNFSQGSYIWHTKVHNVLSETLGNQTPYGIRRPNIWGKIKRNASNNSFYSLQMKALGTQWKPEVQWWRECTATQLFGTQRLLWFMFMVDSSLMTPPARSLPPSWPMNLSSRNGVFLLYIPFTMLLHLHQSSSSSSLAILRREWSLQSFKLPPYSFDFLSI